MGIWWIIQRELGETIVYLYQVELPRMPPRDPQHVGSEGLYYFEA
jgi:hypothetical protein